MSDQHHDEPEGVALAHYDEHDVDVDELGPDEPRTPGWMPLLGGVLFVSAAIFFVATQPPGKTAEELQAAAQKAAEEAAARNAPPPAPPQPAMPAPAAAAPGGARPAQGG
jgi:hypothetical protein